MISESPVASARSFHAQQREDSGEFCFDIPFIFTILVLVDENGEEVLALQYSDYREVDGFRLPHQIQYFESQQLLATDRFERIDIERARPS